VRFILLLSLLLPLSVGASQTDIATAIRALNPSLPQPEITSYSGIINEYSQEYGVEWEIAVAIFKQESNFDLKAVNYLSRDFGIGQMHYKTIQARKLDLGLLLTDDNYAIGETFKLLSELKAKYDKIDKRKGRKWYTRYHSFTHSYRGEYAERLEKHLKVIKRLFDDGRIQKKRKVQRRGREEVQRPLYERDLTTPDSSGQREPDRPIDVIQTSPRRELEGRETTPR